MAGIGFELRRILKKNNYTGDIYAYFIASFYSTPWLFAAIALILLNIISKYFLFDTDIAIIAVTITYDFVISLISVAPVQAILIRYIGDVCRGPNDKIDAAVLFTSFSLAGFLALVAGISFYVFSEGDMLYKFISISLVVVTNWIWLGVTVLQSFHKHFYILKAFCAGSLISLGMAIGLGKMFSLSGTLVGYGMGQAIILLFLMANILKSINKKCTCFFHKKFLSYFLRFPSLAFIGFFYMSAIWIDKIVIWSLLGTKIWSNLYVFLPYDVCVFIAYVTIIPGAAHFLIKMETSFVGHYKAYLDALENEILAVIYRRKMKALGILQKIVRDLIKFQGIFSFIVFVYAYQIFRVFHVTIASPYVFRILIVTAFIHTILMAVITIHLYFNFRKQALFLALFFFFSNFVLTACSVFLGPSYYGWGYLISCLMTLVLGTRTLSKGLVDLEYFIFSGSC